MERLWLSIGECVVVASIVGFFVRYCLRHGIEEYCLACIALCAARRLPTVTVERCLACNNSRIYTPCRALQSVH